MKKLIETARRSGWRAAIEERLKEIDPEAYSYARDETRANWRCLLPVGKGSEVVFYCGRDFGSVAEQLAANYGAVMHLAATEEEARFLRLRAGERPRGNLHVVVGSVLNAPFGRGAFDIAIIDGIEEMAAAGARGRARRKGPMRAVESAAEALKPKGLMLVNSGRKLTPRALIARLAAASAGKAKVALGKLPGLRGKLSMHVGAADMLAAGGLELMTSYAAIPHFKDNLYLVPADSPDALKYVLEVLGAARVYMASRKMRLALASVRFFLRLNLARPILHLVPASVAMARKRSDNVA